MPPPYELAIIAPDQVVLETRVVSLVAPGREGSFGVLARHAPLVAELVPGEIVLRDSDGREAYYAVSRGFLEVTWEGVTVLVDAAEEAGEVDLARAEAARERAEHRLESGGPEVDLARAEAALQRALNRLRVARRHRRSA